MLREREEKEKKEKDGSPGAGRAGLGGWTRFLANLDPASTLKLKQRSSPQTLTKEKIPFFKMF